MIKKIVLCLFLTGCVQLDSGTSVDNLSIEDEISNLNQQLKAARLKQELNSLEKKTSPAKSENIEQPSSSGNSSQSDSPTSIKSPFSNQRINDEKVRVILVDISFGVEDYYRTLDTVDSKEALIRWDRGIRVTNLESFERKKLEELGWKIVYKGTNTPVNGESVELTVLSEDSVNYDEAKVKYILTDITNGVELDYYKEQTSLEAFEAVKRWEDGVRVLNKELFERKQIEGQGWQIVYKGSEEKISGNVVSLSPPNSFDESRIRYIMADIELGVEESFYSGLDEEEAKEAIRRRKEGMVVSNLTSFAKEQLPDIGWKVVYKGTKTPINGLAVELEKK